MNKLKNKNKSIPNSNSRFNQDSEQVKLNNHQQIKSKNNFNCIGPCYPPGIVFYNPLEMTSHINNDEPMCPIFPIFYNNMHKTNDICNKDDINNNYAEFDIFNDFFQIASNHYTFLSQIYNINNITDTVHFITNNFDVLPIYSQKRLLNSIFEVYYIYIEFPKKIFVEKLKNVLKEIYDIKIYKDEKIISDLDKLKKLNIDLYQYFQNKYLKK